MKRVKGSGFKVNETKYKVTAGCDVDKNFVVIAVYNPDETHIFTKEFEQTLSGAVKAAKHLISSKAELVILESTANYHVLFYDVFRENGLNARIINPLLVKALLRVEGKSDKSDAMTLAKLASGFTLKTSNMPDEMQRQIRLYMRNLDQQKQRRTQLSNRAISNLTAYGCTLYRVTKLNSVSGLGILEGICLGKATDEILGEYWKGSKSSLPKLKDAMGNVENIPEYVRFILNEILDEIRLLNSAIEEREKQALSLIKAFGLDDVVSLMCTAPAFTPLLALRVIGEMGLDFVERYPSNEAFCKAVGVVPSNVVSGGKVLKKSSSHGNKHLKQHLLNSVKSWCVTSKQAHPLKSFYIAYKHRSNFKKATSAVARKIMTSLYAMMKSNQPYQAHREFKNEKNQQFERTRS